MTEAALAALKAYIDAKIEYELAYRMVGEDGHMVTAGNEREVLRIAERYLDELILAKGAPPQRDSRV